MPWLVDRDGKFIKGCCENTPIPEDLIQVPGPPEDGRQRWDFERQAWLPFERPYDERRALELEKIPVKDQLDACYKLAALVLPLLELEPDINAPVDTPQGLVARIGKIKADNPKPPEGK